MKNIFLALTFAASIFPLSAKAQETGFPLMRVYSPKEYKNTPQALSIFQDKRGVIYVGIGNGFMEYDGIRWKYTVLPAKNVVRSWVQGNDGNIYMAMDGGFGRLDHDGKGRAYHESFLGMLRKGTSEIGLWVVSSAEGYVYFVAPHAALRYDTSKKSSITFSPPDSTDVFAGTFIQNGVFYARTKKNGLVKLADDRLVPAPGGDAFAGKNDFSFYAPVQFSGGGTLLPTRTEGVLLYDAGAPQPVLNFTIAETGFLQDQKLMNTMAVGGGYLIGSSKKGALLIDNKGSTIRLYGSAEGMPSTSVYNGIVDAAQNMWVGTSGGIAKTEQGLDLGYWDKKNGVGDIVEAFVRHEGDIYFATHQKLNYIDRQNRLGEINNVPLDRGWTLMPFSSGKDSLLLFASNTGLYSVKNRQAKQIYDGELMFEINRSLKNPDRIYTVDNDQLVSLLYTNGNWVAEGKWEGVSGAIRGILEDEKGILWMGTFRGGVIRVEPDFENITKPKSVKLYAEKEGFKSLVNILPFRLGGKTVFGSGAGLFFYNENTDRFEPFCGLGERFCDGSQDVFTLSEMPDGKIWMLPLDNTKADPGYLQPDGKGGYKWVYKPFRRLPEMSLMVAFLAEENGVTWFGGNEGVYRYDPSKDTKDYGQKFNCLVREVKAGDSLLYAGGPNPDPNLPNLNFDQNTLKFLFGAPFFDQEEKTLYSFFLEGFDEKWSDWGRQAEKEYTNLEEGTYTFRVKARNVYDVESAEVVYAFRIEPPLYRTWWAYSLYALVAGFSVFSLIKANSRRLENEKLHLEDIVKQRTAQLEQQKEEILMQSENLLQQKEEIESIAENLKGANTEIQEAYQDFQVLSEIGQKITSSLDFNSILELIYTSVNELMPAEVFGIGLYNPEKQEIEYKLAVEKGQRYKPYTRDAKDKNQFPVWCIDHKQEVFVNNIFSEFKNYIDYYDDERTELADGTLSEVVESLIYLPLLIEGRVTGIVTVQAFRKNAYTPQHLTMLRTLGSYISIAVENSNSFLLISEKNEVISAKNAQITDSIRYARTIQDAILPSATAMSAYLKHFVFYQPKDIVSGDFYWFAHIETEGRVYEFVAAVDCTGHGVPGAFMSMIGYAVLNEAVKEKKILEPAHILESLDAGVRLALHQEEKANEDGMDVAMARIEKTPSATSIVFGGAKRSAYLFKNGLMEEIKGTKRSIGGLQLKQRAFEQETLEVVGKAMLFLFTDGFADQTNPENKKMGSLALLGLLQNNALLPYKEQGACLGRVFNDFKGDAKQKDDVTVIGIGIE